VTAVQRWSREGAADRQRPSSASRYGQTASITGAVGVGLAAWGSLGSTMGWRRIPARCWMGPRRGSPGQRKNPGDDLFSRKAALSVSSALESLTSVFGMGTGMASPLESPGFVASGRVGSGCVRSHGPARAPRRIFDLVGVSRVVEMIHDSQPLTPGQLLKRSSPRPLVPLSFIRHRTSTCGLSNRWSPCGLTRLTRWGTSSRGELRT
jgi:hypothetical protein